VRDALDSPPFGQDAGSDSSDSHYYSVSQAAALLGVSRVTVWRWIGEDRLRAARLGHRTTRIKREDLDAFVAQCESTRFRSRSLREAGARRGTETDVANHPAEDPSESGAGEHIVQFYESDESLLDSVAEFLAAGLGSGDAGILLATPEHRAGVEERLRAAGLDTAAVQDRGRFVSADAAAALAACRIDGTVDPEHFQKAVGDIVTRAVEEHRHVHVFGELVALLVEEGDHAAALRLEQLWNDLQRALGFTLMCGYPMDGFGGAALAEVFGDVCAEHSRVIPAEGYAALNDPDDPRRIIAELQQKTVSLEREIAQREAAEEALRAGEERFRALITASSDVVYRMSPDWREMRRLEGRDFIAHTGEPTGTWLETYIHPDDQPHVMAAISNAIRTKSTFELEHRVRRVDGTLGWTLSRAVPLLDVDGEIVEWVGTASDVTRRKEAEEAAAVSRAAAERQRRLYEAILTNTPDQAYIFDLNHRFTYANEGLLKMWGRTWDEAIGKSCLELGYPEWHAARHDREIEQVIATKQPIRGEVPFSGAFGRRIYDYIFVPVLGSDGEVEAVAGTTRDVTDYWQAEALQSVEVRVLELVAQRTPLPRVLTELTRAVEELADGMLASVLLLDEDGQHLRHGAAPSLPDTYTRGIDGIQIGPAVGSCGTAVHRRERVVVTDIAVDPLWVDFRELALAHGLHACWSTPIRGAGGDVLGTFALYYRAPREPSPGELDLIDRVVRVAALAIERARSETERARLLARERAARTETETLYRVGQALSAELDLQKLLQAVTDAATELSGAHFGAFFYNVVKAEGESYMLYTLSGAPREAFDRFPMPRNTSIFGPTFRGEGIVRLDDVTRDSRYGNNPPYYGMPKGHLPVRSYLAVPVVSARGEVFGGLFFGHPEPGVFTERAERLVAGIAAQAAIALDNARLYQQVQEALRMRDTFLTAAAHDLKTPLTSVKGMAQLLRRRAAQGNADSDRLAEGLASIDTAASRMTQQLDELLDVTRLQMGQPLALRRRPTDLVAVVRRVAAEQQQTAECHRIHVEASRPELVGAWDEVRLARVVNNLVGNAIKYSPEGGDVAVTLAAEEDAGGTWAVLRVRDQGVGIPAADLPHIFDRFHRASNVGGISGAGIGLASARQIVEQHGGVISAESIDGAGSVFAVRLPIGPGEDDPTTGEAGSL